MATTNVEKSVLDTVKKRTTVDDTINRFLTEQEEQFPKAADIEVEFKYSDPFEVPQWVDQQNYAFAWLDPTDDIQMHRALDNEFFKLVTRSSSCIKSGAKGYDKDFRAHGAVERQRMVLAFRPKDLDSKLRTHSVVQHAAMIESVSTGKETEGYTTSFDKFRGDVDKGGSIDVVAYEEAGTEGIKGV
jgi:hypothetical protein